MGILGKLSKDLIYIGNFSYKFEQTTYFKIIGRYGKQHDYLKILLKDITRFLCFPCPLYGFLNENCVIGFVVVVPKYGA